MSCELWNSRTRQHGKRSTNNLHRARKLAFDECDDHGNVYDGFDQVKLGHDLGYGYHDLRCALYRLGALCWNSAVHRHSQQ